jgi:hypothetical protein
MRLLAGISAIAVVVLAAGALAQTPVRKAALPTRHNEVTLAGLRPGRQTEAQAVRLLGDSLPWMDSYARSWASYCARELLTIHIDDKDKIETITAARFEWTGECVMTERTRWNTGLGLRVGDAATRVIQLYGQPDSRSPSTKDGQRLELLYYAFDWAGPGRAAGDGSAVHGAEGWQAGPGGGVNAGGV